MPKTLVHTHVFSVAFGVTIGGALALLHASTQAYVVVALGLTVVGVLSVGMGKRQE